MQDKNPFGTSTRGDCVHCGRLVTVGTGEELICRECSSKQGRLKCSGCKHVIHMSGCGFMCILKVNGKYLKYRRANCKHFEKRESFFSALLSVIFGKRS